MRRVYLTIKLINHIHHRCFLGIHVLFSTPEIIYYRFVPGKIWILQGSHWVYIKSQQMEKWQKSVQWDKTAMSLYNWFYNVLQKKIDAWCSALKSLKKKILSPKMWNIGTILIKIQLLKIWFSILIGFYMKTTFSVLVNCYPVCYIFWASESIMKFSERQS